MEAGNQLVTPAKQPEYRDPAAAVVGSVFWAVASITQDLACLRKSLPAAPRPGLRRVLDPPGPLTPDRQLPGKQAHHDPATMTAGQPLSAGSAVPRRRQTG
jgi:hypothetical protein